MLSGEGNANGEKTTVGLISKKATLHVQHTFFGTFLCLCFARLQRETSRNFVEEMSYVFLLTFFSLPLFFTLVAAIISHFLTAATNFHVVLPTKNVSFVFYLSLYWALCRSFSHWASLAYRLLSLYLCLSLSLYSKFVDMRIDLI